MKTVRLNSRVKDHRQFISTAQLLRHWLVRPVNFSVAAIFSSHCFLFWITWKQTILFLAFCSLFLIVAYSSILLQKLRNLNKTFLKRNKMNTSQKKNRLKSLTENSFFNYLNSDHTLRLLHYIFEKPYWNLIFRYLIQNHPSRDRPRKVINPTKELYTPTTLVEKIKL